jgi:hypothetical protein
MELLFFMAFVVWGATQKRIEIYFNTIPNYGDHRL